MRRARRAVTAEARTGRRVDRDGLMVLGILLVVFVVAVGIVVAAGVLVIR